MRLHRNLCFALIDGLHLIFNEGEYADKVIQQLLKRDKRWGSRDRGFVAETVYTIVRYQRLYAEIADVKAPYDRDNLWRIFAVWATLKGIKLPDWKYFTETPSRKIKGRFDELIKIRKYRESIPDWIDELGVKELGEAEWTKEMAMQGLTCGALTGGLMVIGAAQSHPVPANRLSRDRARKTAARLIHWFEEQQGTTNCRDLLNLDISTPGGMETFAASDLNESRCMPLVEETCRDNLSGRPW